jgi:hypothetical protein
MSTTRPFAYNTGPSIPGTTQVGDIAIGVDALDYSENPGGVKWWNGPDEDLGYVIAHPVSGNTQPTPLFSGAPSGQLTLSSTYKGVDIQLTNSQIATQLFGYQQSVLGQTLLNNVDKVMFSVLSNLCPNLGNPFFQSIGVGMTSMNYSTQYGAYPGNDSQSVGFSMDGNFYTNGSIVASSLPTWTTNDIIDVAVNLTSGVIWIRVNGGYWNNNINANPEIGTGGLSLYGLTSFYPVLSPGNNVGQMTIQNTSTYGVPSGYTLLGTNITASVGFWRSDFKTEESFIQLSELIAATDNDPQTFVDGDEAKTWLNDNGYWTSYTPSTPFNDLITIAQYLRNYMPDFRNPSFYDYRLDGSGFEIDDGGGDMYDNGNISSPWVVSNTEYISTDSYDSVDYPYAVDYTNSATTETLDTSFGYISLGYEQFNGSQSDTYLPLTVLGSRDNETYGPGLPVGFQTGGNSGADGGGALSSGLIYSAQTLSGFTVYAFYRETYSAGDPSHCDLYILLGHSNWSSTFGTVSSFAQPTGVGGCGGYLYTTGAGTQNILAIKTLLSKDSGQLVTSAECQTVVDNFVIRIKQALNW